LLSHVQFLSLHSVPQRVVSTLGVTPVIEEVEKKIRQMDSSFGPDWKTPQTFYARAATHFMFLKDAWRNHIMHAGGAPYDEGRAFSVLEHVRQFMRALAEGGLKE
jgi:hypothetical protein